MTLSEIARAAEVAPGVVRHYARVGLLSPRRDPKNHYRRFDGADLKRLGFIIAAQELGFKLAEIGEILRDSDEARSPCPRVREIMARRIGENRQRLNDLQAMQERMESAYSVWRSMPDGGGTGEAICPLIEAMDGTRPRSGEAKSDIEGQEHRR